MKKYQKDFYIEWWTHQAKEIPVLSKLFGWYKMTNHQYNVVSYDKAKNSTTFYLNGRKIVSQRKKMTVEMLQKAGVPVPGGQNA